MGKKGRVALAALFALLLGGLAWELLCPSEPVYQGKPLGYYLDHLAAHYPPKAADDSDVKTIHAMGPKAIPHLRRAFRRKNSAYVKSLVFLRAKLPKGIATRLPDPKPDYLNNVSGAAAHALATFGPTASEALPDLIRGLEDRSTANMAIYAITEIGPKPANLPALLSLLNSTNQSSPIYAASCVGRIGLATPEVLAALTQATSGQAVYQRTTAIDALGELGTNAQSAAAVLTRNLGDSNAYVRIASAGALWKIRGKTNPPVAWLTQALDDEVNHGAIPSNVPGSFGEHEINLLIITQMLKGIGKEAQPAVAALRAVTREKDVRLRMNAVEALWRINDETNAVVSISLEALTHSDPNVRVVAVRLLTDFCIEHRLILPEFEKMLESEDSFTRFYAARALLKFTTETSAALPVVIASGLDDHFTYYRNAEIRQLAAETLGEMGARARPVGPALLKAMNDGVEKVRLAATNALRKIDPETSAKSGVK
jgi:HEAT repeat protein